MKVSERVVRSKVGHRSVKHFMSTVFVYVHNSPESGCKIYFTVGCNQKSVKVIDLRGEWWRAED